MKYVDHSDVALSENMPRQSAFTNFAVALVITHSSCECLFVQQYRAMKNWFKYYILYSRDNFVILSGKYIIQTKCILNVLTSTCVTTAIFRRKYTINSLLLNSVINVIPNLDFLHVAVK